MTYDSSVSGFVFESQVLLEWVFEVQFYISCVYRLCHQTIYFSAFQKVYIAVCLVVFALFFPTQDKFFSDV